MLTNGFTALVRRTVPLAIASSALTAVGAAQSTFLSQDGLICIEFESATLVDDWRLSTSTPGFLDEGYIEWRGPNLFSQPGQSGIFFFDFEVEDGGRWNLSLRNRHEDLDPTEENDVWIRMDDGPWIKTFSNMPGSVGAWTWETRFDLSSTNQPGANYTLTPGTHRIFFSGRSFGFKMDRLHLWRPGNPNATNPNIEESPRRFGIDYCDAVPNSTGVVSTIDTLGSPEATSDDDLILTCSDLPAGVVGTFLASRSFGFVANPAGSAGNLCLGGSIGRFPAILGSGSGGVVSLRFELDEIPQPTGSVALQPGDTWRFQFWHRDAGNASNFSRGRRVNFE
ncbi:MAG: hypothetical protein AAGA20_17325 [Planctomycetota bacterium]